VCGEDVGGQSCEGVARVVLQRDTNKTASVGVGGCYGAQRRARLVGRGRHSNLIQVSFFALGGALVHDGANILQCQVLHLATSALASAFLYAFPEKNPGHPTTGCAGVSVGSEESVTKASVCHFFGDA
jgi:hypothetical protein|tara:strand:- start:412 stop:795 length:384 start_codon:yes stop_codon:yes gene_type:complete